MNRTNWNRWKIGAFGAVAVAVVLAVITLASRPFGQDQGIFAWIAETILRGGLPYRDAWDIKGPTVYYTWAAIQAVFGPNPTAFRLVDYVIGTFGVAAVWRLAVGVGGAGWLAGALFALWWLDLDYENSLQPDGWIAVLLAGAMCAALRRSYFLVGFALGMGTLAKPLYLLCALPVAAYLIKVERSRLPLKALGLATAGGLVPIALATGWFELLGGLNQMVDVYLRYSSQIYAGEMGLQRTVSNVGTVFATSRSLAIAVVVAIGGLGTMCRRRQTAEAMLLGGTMLTLVFVIALQDKNFPYHKLPLYAPVAVLFSAGLAGLVGSATIRFSLVSWRQVAAIVLLCLVAAPSLRRIENTTYEILRTTIESSGAPNFHLREYSSYAVPYGEFARAAAYVRANSSPSETVQVFGQMAGFYVMAVRWPPTRYGTSQPVVQGDGSLFQASYRTEFMTQVLRNPPRFVFARSRESCRGRRIRLQCLESFPDFDRFVSTRYLEAARFGEYVLYQMSGN